MIVITNEAKRLDLKCLTSKIELTLIEARRRGVFLLLKPVEAVVFLFSLAGQARRGHA